MRLAAFLLAFAAAAALAASEKLQRKSGLWHITMSGAHIPHMQLHECVDRNQDDMTTPEEPNACSKIDVRRQSGGFVVDSVCKVDGSTATARTVITGSFDSAYKAETKVSYRPPVEGVGESTMKVEGRWLGATCKPGQKPGDTDVVDLPVLPKKR